MSVLPLAIAIVVTAVAQVLYKLYFTTGRRWYLVPTVLLFCTAPVMSYIALKQLPLSTVYMATGLTYVIVAVLANLVLNERIDRRKAQAMALIVGGAVVFNL